VICTDWIGVSVVAYNGSCANPFSWYITSINEVYKNKLNIYPNPTNSRINIDLNANEKVEVTIINILGKTVYKGTISEQNNQIDVSTFAKGIYTVLTSKGSAKFVISD
jgi:hypothetical protein